MEIDQIANMQAQIDQLQKRLAEQDAFVSKAIHNLKNLLAHVIGCDQYIMTTYSEVFSEFERHLMEEADTTSFYINDILDGLSTIIQTRRPALAIAPIQMEQIVPGVHSQLQAKIADCNAQIRYPNLWPPVMGNAELIGKVWLNLLSNALTYTEQPPRIIVQLSELTDTNQVCFSVTDNGVGLTDAQKALMFTPFPRIQAATPNVGGLGLYVVRTIIERLGGTVGVESMPGQGAMFSFTLPRSAPNQ